MFSFRIISDTAARGCARYPGSADGILVASRHRGRWEVGCRSENNLRSALLAQP
jgi:hypothetical protein